jgi:hypothetical protein
MRQYQYNPRFNKNYKFFNDYCERRSRLTVFKIVSSVNIFSGLFLNYSNKAYIGDQIMFQNVPQIIGISLVKGWIYEAFFPLIVFCTSIEFLFGCNIDKHIIPGLKYGTIDYGRHVKNYKQ